MGAKKQYSAAFKREAIRLQARRGKTVAEVARDLGLRHGLLRHWKQRFQLPEGGDGLELSEVEQLKAELRRTKRELESVQQARDILKKTVGSFSKDGSRSGMRRLSDSRRNFPSSGYVSCWRGGKVAIMPG
jgi:transposase